jgi:plastocyanin
MRMRSLLFGGLAVVAVVASGCSNDDDSAAASPSTTVADAMTMPVTAPTSSDPAPTAPAAASTAVTVEIADFAFDAPTVHVAVGGTVTWTNNDDQQHTATSAGNFDTGAIKPGASMTVTFESPGTFAYACSFHPFMTGTVIVG